MSVGTGVRGSVDVQDAEVQGSNDTKVNNRGCARYVWGLAKRGDTARPRVYGTMADDVEHDERTRFGAVADDRRQR